MKDSEQIGSGGNVKSGQKVAKHNFGKTDVRYWHGVIFKAAYGRNGETLVSEDWATRIQWRGRRELFNLRTANKAAAAAKARDIYTSLVGAGWDKTLDRFKPEIVRKSVSTIGDFLNELREHWSGKPKTFEDYCRRFRKFSASTADVKNSITSKGAATPGSIRFM